MLADPKQGGRKEPPRLLMLGLKLRTLRVGAALWSPPSSPCPLKNSLSQSRPRSREKIVRDTRDRSPRLCRLRTSLWRRSSARPHPSYHAPRDCPIIPPPYQTLHPPPSIGTNQLDQHQDVGERDDGGRHRAGQRRGRQGRPVRVEKPRSAEMLSMNA